MASFIGPIVGVVDGSNAAPGEVGEFLTLEGTFNYAASPAFSSGTIPLLNVPPGDWDFWVFAGFSTPIGYANFRLPVIPPGLSNEMAAGMGGDPPEIVVTIGSSSRGSFAVATQLTFNVEVSQAATGLLAGVMTMKIEARRRR